MKLAFILGRTPPLSVLEIKSVLQKNDLTFSVLECSNEVMVVEVDGKKSILPDLMKKLGGTIKIVKLGDDVVRKRFEEIKESKTKVNLGISGYFLDNNRDSQEILEKRKDLVDWVFDKKKELKKEGVKIRVVTVAKRAVSLSSVVVRGNKMIREKGLEVVRLYKNGEVVETGITQEVQDFKAFSYRDYRRPVRNAKVGMTPPKLAMMMLNISGAREGARIIDPFCGLGTFLQEGLLLGYEMEGADIEGKMVEASKKNLGWFFEKEKDFKVFQGDVKNISGLVKGKFDAVVTEGFLGPLFERTPNEVEKKRIWGNLEGLYRGMFLEIKKILSSEGSVVMAMPFYWDKKNIYLYPFVDKIEDLGYRREYLVPSCLSKTSDFFSKRGTILYRRNDQIVGREIIKFVIKKNGT